MLPEQLPPCVFGHTNWTGGGGSFGSGLCQQWFTCQDCGLTALVISAPGGNILLIPQKMDVLEGDERRIPKEISAWIDVRTIFEGRMIRQSTFLCFTQPDSMSFLG